MKQLLIPLALVLIVLLSYFVISQTTGQFVIGNEPPFVVADTFAAKDGPAGGDWDNTITIDTHDLNTQLRFNIKDPNPDVLNARLCIGTSPNPSGAGIGEDCNVVNYNFPVVVPGQHAGAQGAQLLYTYNTDPTGTLEGTSATIGLTQSDCALGVCAKTFYADIIVDDNNGEVTTDSNEFDLINFVPNTPNSLIVSDNHDPTPSLSWTATDTDESGSVDSWPADTLTYHITVGANSPGDTNYLSDPAGSTPSSTVSSAIPWGTSGATQAITTVQVRIWSTDNFGIDSVFFDTTFDLIDNLPGFVNLHLSEAGLSASDSCVDFLPQSCDIIPSEADYAAVVLNMTINDLDADCSDLNHNINVVLCLEDAVIGSDCNPTTNNYRNYNLQFESQTGTTCYFSIDVPQSNPQGIEYFQAPGVYKLNATAASQAGKSTIWPSEYQWEFQSLFANNLASSITLGDAIIELGQYNPGTTSAPMRNTGNVALALTWDATDAELGGFTVGCSPSTSTCWDITSEPGFQLDDDNDCLTTEGTGCLQSTETGLNVVNVPETGTSSVSFNPVSGLLVCNDFACTGPTDSVLLTNYHIKPPIGLQAGTYQTEITPTMQLFT